ncbi:sulfite reductase subunit alpha [Actomonas aquatica]|uniref:Sulfite reductase subunit alpha n=1 Tax=Actomonas aquatica TaxID=2866162 RepID=A0ABZ1CC65_9BACT|nr:sulfite reductase subunit alpha [Opitutus sp. WL0086]WRQ89027.1 sulfite reductase subunit alpha [Opitutus sp. WL0086]
MSPTVPFVPDSAPFSPEQRAWLNGFFAGAFCRTPLDQSKIENPESKIPAAATPLTILWGSQTGTAESLAKQAAKTATSKGFTPTILDMAAASPADLAAHENVLVITSTYGEGEPPDNAKALYDAVLADGAPALPGSLRYSVCALGDTNYEAFCQCGKAFDEAFAKLGATRIAERVDCDVDYDEPFATWLEQALTTLQKSEVGSKKNEVTSAATSTSDFKLQTSDLDAAYGRARPFPAPVLTVRNLNGAGSAKEVNHVEFSLTGSGLTYEAGDALSVIPHNCPELVAGVLQALGCDGEEAVTTANGELPLRTALTTCFDLGKPTKTLLELLQLPASDTTLDVLDALHAACPAAIENLKSQIQNPDFLRKLAPRLYSISSSPKAHADQVHLTVGAVRYDHGGRPRKGVCSTFLAERALAAGTAHVFVHSNKAFRPPADPTAPMIMVGPGTGIAPFRAFLQEREATAAAGRNWLFFGDQHAASDYLYQDQIAAWQKTGLLHRVDTAFSRDQAEKIYVQDRMREAGAELWQWLEDGAHFYVCGDAKRMAKDVDLALHDIIATHGQKTAEQAAAYVNALKAAKRYGRDVY